MATTWVLLLKGPQGYRIVREVSSWLGKDLKPERHVCFIESSCADEMLALLKSHQDAGGAFGDV